MLYNVIPRELFTSIKNSKHVFSEYIIKVVKIRRNITLNGAKTYKLNLVQQ